jgi:hypothetical protein
MKRREIMEELIPNVAGTGLYRIEAWLLHWLDTFAVEY